VKQADWSTSCFITCGESKTIPIGNYWGEKERGRDRETEKGGEGMGEGWREEEVEGKRER